MAAPQQTLSVARSSKWHYVLAFLLGCAVTTGVAVVVIVAYRDSGAASPAPCLPLLDAPDTHSQMRRHGFQPALRGV